MLAEPDRHDANNMVRDTAGPMARSAADMAILRRPPTPTTASEISPHAGESVRADQLASLSSIGGPTAARAVCAGRDARRSWAVPGAPYRR